MTYTRPSSRATIAAAVLLSLLAGLAPYVGSAMSSLTPVVNFDQPYGSGVEPGLLYVLMPLSVIGSVALVLSPGLLCSLLIGRARTLWEWLVEGFGISLVLLSATVAVAQAVIGHPITGITFIGAVLTLTVVAAGLLSRRVADGRSVPSPWATADSSFDTASAIGIPLLVLLALTPKIFWEAFNGDGAHAFEAARMLLTRGVPFIPPEAGTAAEWPGMNTAMAPYVASWFMRLFGPTEAGVRLPVILCVPLLFSAITMVAEAGREGLGRAAKSLIWAGVVSITLVMAYSATYDPYSADLALPASQDMFVMVAYLAAVSAFLRADNVRLSLWTFIALLTSPAALPLFAASLVGLLVAERPWRWRLAATHSLGFAGCLVLLAVAPWGLQALGNAPPGWEHSGLTLLKQRFSSVALLDLNRIAWVLVPGGLYAAAGLLRWRRPDATTRALICATGLLFAFYYPMGSVPLHYFVPLMVLPVVIFWRQFGSALSRAQLTGCAAAAAVSIWLALPVTTSIADASRVIGEQIDVQAFTSYHDADPRALKATEALTHLFPVDADRQVPNLAYGGSPLAWNYYAQRAPSTSSTRYRLSPIGEPAPAGAIEAGRTGESIAYVFDEQRWQSDRVLQPRHSRGSALYAIPRSILFAWPEAMDRPGAFRNLLFGY